MSLSNDTLSDGERGSVATESNQSRRVPMWCVYILECRDGAYYTGLTADLERRLREHREGTAHYTGYNPPVKLLYQESFAIKSEAEQREAKLKRWSQSNGPERSSLD